MKNVHAIFNESVVYNPRGPVSQETSLDAVLADSEISISRMMLAVPDPAWPQLLSDDRTVFVKSLPESRYRAIIEWNHVTSLGSVVSGALTFARRCSSFILASFFVFLASSLQAQNYPSVSLWCERGNVTVTINSGLTSTQKFQQSYPQCTVDVYLPGTTTHVTLYSNATGTGKGNPFTASTTGLATFYVTAGVYDIRLSSAGIPSPFTIPSVNVPDTGARHFITPQMYGAKADGTTNDTTAVTSCLTQASIAAEDCYAPAGTYAICNVVASIGSGKTASLYGDGFSISLFRRHTSCALTNTDLIDLPAGTGAVDFHDFGIDNVNTTGSPLNQFAININTDPIAAGPSSVTIDHVSCSHGSVVCIQISNANNVTFTNNFCDHSWNYCVSVQGAVGGTGSPTYNHGFNFHGNTYIDTPVGLAFNFFVSDIAVTGEVFKQSTLAFIQVPHAYGVVSGVTFDGSPDYGSNIGPSGSASAIFNEGSSDLVVNGLECYNVTAPSSYCYYGQGSNLQIPAMGTTLQLQLNRNSISNMYMTASPGILYSGPSTDATVGQYLTIDTPTIINNTGAPGISLTGVSHVVMSGSGLLDNLKTGGIALDNVKDWSLSGWKLHNTGVAVAGTYPAIQIVNTATLNGYISNTAITSDGGNSNSYCIEDDRLNGGTATQTRTQGLTLSGCTATLPTAAIPTLGAWNAGDFIQDFSGKLGYINTVAGSPGTWLCTGCGPFGIGGVATSGTTGTIGLTNLNPLTLPLSLGLYRVSWVVEPTNTCGTQGPAQVVLSLSYNDGFANRTPTLGTIAIGGSQVPTQGSFTAYISSSGSSGHLQYTSVYTACSVGTGSYNLNMMMEKLQ